MKRKSILVALWVVALFIGVVEAGDLDEARASAEAKCQTCHGMDGLATIATAPNLSGQPKEYLKIQLEAYRDGNRQHPQMSIIAQGLSDDDIENVSEWYSAIKISVQVPE